MIFRKKHQAGMTSYTGKKNRGVISLITSDILRPDPVIAGFIALFIALNMFYLDSFPFVHSDEAWLASLTRTMTEKKSIAVTEEFFKITERNPHAVKTLFHLFQMPFLLADYSVMSARSLSVLCSSVSLVFFYLYFRKTLKGKIPAVLALLLVSSNVQFLYISRFARQESMLLMTAAIQLYLLGRYASTGALKLILTASLVSGLSIAVHPNSFIVFTGMLFFLFLSMHANSIRKWKGPDIAGSLGIYCAVNLVFLIFIVFLSFLMDENFIQNYIQFGRMHGTGDSMLVKVIAFPRFVYKLMNRIQGTYYLPDTAWQFFVFAVAIAMALMIFVFSKEKGKSFQPEVFLSAGMMTGIVAIGKYSPPSAVFFMIPSWIAVIRIVAAGSEIPGISLKAAKAVTASILISLAAVNIYVTWAEIKVWKDYRFQSFGRIIKSNTEEEGRVLAPTGAEFFLESGRLCSYHDLFPLGERVIGFEEYIERFDIKTIIWTEELEIIVRERPQWNGMYGNVYSFYDEARKFLDEKCVLTARESIIPYAVRLAERMPEKKHEILFYRLKK